MNYIKNKIKREHPVARLTSRIQESAADKRQKQYEAIVKVIEIFVDINYPLTSLLYECKRILASGRGVRSDTPHQVRRENN